MANPAKRLGSNVAGNFFVDSTCINCDTCRQLAPDTFAERDDYSFVHRQPTGEPDLLQAYQALLACPVGSIGTFQTDKRQVEKAMGTFPIRIDGEVYYNGFHSEKSFGASSYFVRHETGNWLVDSPRYLRHLVDAFERLGGVRYLFLSHEDDVADAGRYAKRFGATRIIHRADLGAQPDAEIVIDGDDPVEIEPGFLVIPVPGHTAGSLALLYDDRYLFSGDHLSWDRETGRLYLATVYVWSEERLRRSTRRLLDYSFEWLLPGHGDRMHLPATRMKDELQRVLTDRMRPARPL